MFTKAFNYVKKVFKKKPSEVACSEINLLLGTYGGSLNENDTIILNVPETGFSPDFISNIRRIMFKVKQINDIHKCGFIFCINNRHGVLFRLTKLDHITGVMRFYNRFKTRELVLLYVDFEAKSLEIKLLSKDLGIATMTGDVNRPKVVSINQDWEMYSEIYDLLSLCQRQDEDALSVDDLLYHGKVFYGWKTNAKHFYNMTGYTRPSYGIGREIKNE